jgi:hypothetical protein
LSLGAKVLRGKGLVSAEKGYFQLLDLERLRRRRHYNPAGMNGDSSFCGMRLESSTLLAQKGVLKGKPQNEPSAVVPLYGTMARQERKGALSLGPSDFRALFARPGPTKTRPDKSGLGQFVCPIGPVLRCSAAGQCGLARIFEMDSN